MVTVSVMVTGGERCGVCSGHWWVGRGVGVCNGHWLVEERWSLVGGERWGSVMVTGGSVMVTGGWGEVWGSVMVTGVGVWGRGVGSVVGDVGVCNGD